MKRRVRYSFVLTRAKHQHLMDYLDSLPPLTRAHHMRLALEAYMNAGGAVVMPRGVAHSAPLAIPAAVEVVYDTVQQTDPLDAIDRMLEGCVMRASNPDQ